MHRGGLGGAVDVGALARLSHSHIRSHVRENGRLVGDTGGPRFVPFHARLWAQLQLSAPARVGWWTGVVMSADGTRFGVAMVEMAVVVILMLTH